MIQAQQQARYVERRLGRPVSPKTHNIGEHFQALHFSEDMFDGAMDPLLMVDHFVMTGPTFEPHLHAGISAVTAMFEDARGQFLNRDTLGHNIALEPGDLYWLAAGRGAAHEERPAEGSRIHALQIFVNLPRRLKIEPARAIHVRREAAPVIVGADHRVRVLLGASGETEGAGGAPEEMTMLDGFLDPGGAFSHPLPHDRQGWLYAVSGDFHVEAGGMGETLPAGTALAVTAGEATDIVLSSVEGGRFFLAAARPIREPFFKSGPLVMASPEDVRRTLADYADGRFGRLTPPQPQRTAGALSLRSREMRPPRR